MAEVVEEVRVLKEERTEAENVAQLEECLSVCAGPVVDTSHHKN